MADDGEEVLLYVYDLSNGLARLMSQNLLGKQIDGVWHTSVVVGHEEVYFGQGIQKSVPGATPHGQPVQVISLGSTFVPHELREEFLAGLSSSDFAAHTYDLFRHNCNTFSAAFAEFLTGNSIPEHILALPAEEKSKRAQKRYRERKKAQTEDYKRQIEELTARLSNMSAEKANLESRNTLLEKVVRLKGDGTMPQQSLQALGLGGEPRGDAQANYLMYAATFLDKVYPGRGMSSSLRMEHIKNMGASDFYKVWKDCISRLTHLLLEGGEEPDTEAHRALVELIESNRWTVLSMATHDSRKLMALTMAVKSISVSQAGPPPAGHHEAVLATLNLSEEQKQRLLDARRALINRVEGIVSERRALVEALRGSLPRDAAGLRQVPGRRPLQEALGAAERLAENLRRDHEVAWGFTSTFTKTVLTPVQEARCLVGSYPYHPDVLAYSTAIARELGDPCAHAPALHPDAPLELAGAGQNPGAGAACNAARMAASAGYSAGVSSQGMAPSPGYPGVNPSEGMAPPAGYPGGNPGQGMAVQGNTISTGGDRTGW
ncbi:hypothetical protein WJX81_001518 [Elliptochloris bilobata]|uniref:PPPDE domain-containing protein n=1 Tax=Elliptochloris bilobata TaxID=381761 RepID=A0AAW1QXA8_9CHLO